MRFVDEHVETGLYNKAEVAKEVCNHAHKLNSILQNYIFH